MGLSAGILLSAGSSGGGLTRLQAQQAGLDTEEARSMVDSKSKPHTKGKNRMMG